VTADAAAPIKAHMPRNIWRAVRAVRMGSGRRTKIALSGETQVRSSKFEGGPPSMTMRTTSKTVTFHRPFWLKGVDRLLPPADYRVVTDEELIEGLSFPAYHRVSTVIFVPGPSGSAVEMVTIDPLDLQAAQDQDAAMHTVHPADGR
jgi:hypothetical protein